MDTKKAFEIVESLGVVDVTYNGIPVWIENINEQTNEVKVKDLNSDTRFLVNVSELSED